MSQLASVLERLRIATATTTGSCFICVTGGQSAWGRLVAPAASRPSTLEGFGTCSSCWVHACPQHGDRPAQFFFCVDCLAADGVYTTLVRDDEGAPETPDASLRADLRERGADGLIGSAPRLGFIAEPVAARADEERMAYALDRLRTDLREGGRDVARELSGRAEGTRRGQLALALGLSELEPRNVDESPLGEAVLGMAVSRIRLIATDAARSLAERLRDTDTTSPEDARLAVLAVAMAFSARSAEDLEMGPLAVRGGLAMPPVLVLLAQAYAAA